ncbi:MAG: hypothetical protein JRF53_19400 [Deltaproteobacteria bacterium]|nr:hypothetical protein [Deltaproteobacteria bacterium]
MSDTEMKEQEAFEYVRQNFFPKWDRKGQWTIKIDSDLPSLGRCFQDQKTISLGSVSDSNDELHLLIIHKICHTSIPNHGKKWLGRMAKAANTAKEIGRTKLSQMIQKEVALYKDESILTAQNIYNQIGDAILDVPEASYEVVIKIISREVGIYPNELEKCYKRCRKVYDRNKQWIQKHKQMKAELLKKLKNPMGD